MRFLAVALLGLVGFFGFASKADAQCANACGVGVQSFSVPVQIPLQLSVQPQVSFGAPVIGGVQSFGYGAIPNAGFSAFAGSPFGSVGFNGFSGFNGGFAASGGGGFVPNFQVIDRGPLGRKDVILGQLGGRVLIQRSGLLGRRRLILQ